MSEPHPPAPDAESRSGIDVSFLARLPPEQLRVLLPSFLAGFVDDAEVAAANRARTAELVAAWSDDECRDVVAHLGRIGSAHELYPAHPAGRALARERTRDVILEPTASGIDHLAAAAAAGPTLVACNHTSYLDTTATDAALCWNGHAALADRIVALAGPKVYADLFRRVAAGCLNTLPVPQSTSFGHTEKLSPRELARKAHESLESAGTLLTAGWILLLYPEGSRTRTGRFGSFLRATHRYFGCVEGLRVVPMAITGSDRVMPVSDPRLHPGTVHVACGPALRVGPDGSTRDVLDAAHAAVEALLPPALRPEPGTPRSA